MANGAQIPPKKRRQILYCLTRNRLADLTSYFELEVADRRVVDSHVDALIRARKLDFEEVLGRLKRDELKAICDELELDTGGRAKQVLVDRIQEHRQALITAAVTGQLDIGEEAAA